jgi:N-methylhydantoinase A
MRYEGQGYSLTIPLARDEVTTDGLRRLVKTLAETHEAAYGYVPAHPETEIVNLRATATSASAPFALLGAPAPDTAQSPYTTAVYLKGAWTQVPVYHRGNVEGAIAGPALLEQEDTTILVTSGWTATPIDGGNLLLERDAELGK